MINSPASLDGPRVEQPLLLRRALPAIVALAVVAGVVLTVLGVLADRPHSHLAFQVGWLFPAIFAFLALELMQAELWHRLLGALGGTIDTSHALAIWAVSAVGRYVPTSMLMPIVRVRMSRTRHVPAELSIASVVYEGVLVNCGAACVATYFIIKLPGIHHRFWAWSALLLPLLAVGALHPRVVAFLDSRLLARLGRMPLAIHLSFRQLLSFTAGYVASFLLAGLGLVAVVLMVHPLGWQGVPSVIGAMAIGFIASVFAFVLPGGLGVREAALVLGLSPVLPTLAASTAAVALRLIQLGCELLLAVALPWIAHRHEARE